MVFFFNGAQAVRMVEGFEASCGFVGGRFGQAIRNRAACSHIRYRCTHSTASRPHSCQSHQVPVHTLHSVKATQLSVTSGTGAHTPQRQGDTRHSRLCVKLAGRDVTNVHIRYRYTHSTASRSHSCQSHSWQGEMLPTFTSRFGHAHDPSGVAQQCYPTFA